MSGVRRASVSLSSHERPLGRSFYLQPTLRVTRALLGKVLMHDSREGRTAGRIVEVEAYRGPRDQAAHTAGGRRTVRNETMWGPPGHAYVYFVYGMHYCVNVTTQPPGVPEAVLIRALEPLDGIELMRARRNLFEGPAWKLCRGPGALCRAMGLTRAQDGADLVHSRLRIVDAPPTPPSRIARTARIGVASAGTDALRPWRFLVRGSVAVSGRRLLA